MLAFTAKVNDDCAHVAPADIAALYAAGWNDEAIYDAITVCALFNFYNRWIDATGVTEPSDEEVAESGRRIAQHGYRRTAK